MDDFAGSRLAAAAGLDEAAARLGRRSGSWRHLLSSDRGYLLPRDAAGAFPVDGASSCCDGFQEGTASQYTWGGVPHDMGGLLAGAGPRDDVLRRLDTFHSALNAGAGHHHAWLGNQPSFLTPWAYLWLGEPTRTQDVVARARRELWSVGPGGLPGNEDLGSLSAWYVWTSLGLYPLTPGTANVGLTVPAFDSVTVRPSSGVAMVIERQGSGAHIGEVLVDGVPRTASWLDLSPAPRPGHVLVVTTDDPAPVWGTTPADVPPSYAEGVSDR